MDSEGEHSAKGGYNIVSFYFFGCVLIRMPQKTPFFVGLEP